MTPFPQRSFLHGVLAGLAMPVLALVLLFVYGALDAWLVGGAVYGLMLLFAFLGVPAYVLTRRLRRFYMAHGARPMQFTNGILLGAWTVGVALMWVAQSGADASARLLSSATGGVMLVAFWPWAGSIIAHYEPQAKSGPPDQTQDLSPPPR